MMMRRGPLAAALLALGAAWLLPQPGFALTTKPMNMSDLVRQSEEIVTGTVTEVSQGTDDRGFPYTEIQLRVAEAIRGDARGTLTFRQLGFQTAQPAVDGRRQLNLVAGMPRYTKGDQVALFLSRTSSIGLRTTVGLEQGRFALRGGNFENGVKNAGLFRNVDFSKATLDTKEQAVTTTEVGAVNAEAFLGLVRRAVARNWWAKPLKKEATGGAR